MLRGAGRNLVGGPPGAAGSLCILGGKPPVRFRAAIEVSSRSFR
jgi:hypothetical protein